MLTVLSCLAISVDDIRPGIGSANGTGGAIAVYDRGSGRSAIDNRAEDIVSRDGVIGGIIAGAVSDDQVGRDVHVNPTVV